MISYYYLLNLKYNKFYILYLILFILAIVVIITVNIKVYDEYNTYAIFSEDTLVLDVPTNNSDALNKGTYLVLNHQKYKYEIINISEIKVSNITNYQTYKLKIDKLFKDNELLKITFYYKKEKMIKKILRIIF